MSDVIAYLGDEMSNVAAGVASGHPAGIALLIALGLLVPLALWQLFADRRWLAGAVVLVLGVAMVLGTVVRTPSDRPPPFPDLGPIPHGWGYAIGGVLVAAGLVVMGTRRRVDG